MPDQVPENPGRTGGIHYEAEGTQQMTEPSAEIPWRDVVGNVLMKGTSVVILDGPEAFVNGRVSGFKRTKVEVTTGDWSNPTVVMVKPEHLMSGYHSHSASHQFDGKPRDEAIVELLHIGHERGILSVSQRRKLLAAWGEGRTAENLAQESGRKTFRANERARYAEAITAPRVAAANAALQQRATAMPSANVGEWRPGGVVDLDPQRPGAGKPITAVELAAYTVVAVDSATIHALAFCGKHKTSYGTFSQGEARRVSEVADLWCPQCAKAEIGPPKVG